MTKCKWCDRRLLWGNRAQGLCNRCEEPIRRELTRREKQIKRALVRLHYGSGEASTIEHCQVITEHATALARFEAKGIHTTNPAPSDLLRTAAAHRRRSNHREARGPTQPGGLHRGGPDVDAALRPGAERRTAPREKMEFHVRVDPGGQRAIARDLSAVGIRLETSRGSPPEGPVALILFTAEGALHAQGTVQWTQRRCVAPLQGTAFGVRFTNPDAQVCALSNRA